MSERVLGQAMAEYMDYLKADGKCEKTIYTYGQDAQQIIGFFGVDRKLSGILTPHVGKFLKSDILLKLPNGKCRADLTVKKTIRVLRMFLLWAQDKGYITNLPLPKDVSRGRSSS